MCGIAGILTAPGKRPPQGALEALTNRIRHRGPDALGLHREEGAGLEFGHTRLAIVDLSPAGAQPMVSQSGRYVIVLNGEIYNHRELRKELDGAANVAWRGTSDTEVLLAACEVWGVAATLARLEGMFAFGLWDRDDRSLTLARDRFGEKPLYVGVTGEGIAFASQLGAIMDYPGFAGLDDAEAIEMFLTLSYIPEPRTPFRNVQKLPAGTYARLVAGQAQLEPVAYWSAAHTVRDIRRQRSQMSVDELMAQIEARLSHVIANQMVADVPLGAFLSGGIDSSLVVALMQAQSTSPIKTFTIGFKDEAYNEAPYARAIAKHLGTDHTEVMLDWDEALSLIETLPDIYDEPFADSSQLPTYLVSKVARQSVTVCLSGDGGDEVFAGYNRYRFAMQYSKVRRTIPAALRRPIGHALMLTAQPRMSGLLNALGKVSGATSIRLASEKLSKIGSALTAQDDNALYMGLVRRDEGLLPSSSLSLMLAKNREELSDTDTDLAETMMLLDTKTYLPGDILAKVDRAAMAVALETRVPFLDHQLFGLAWGLGIEDKIKAGRTKSVLRQILAKHVPSDMFERPKAGFGVPIESWLRGRLRPWAEDNLSLFQQANPLYADLVQKARDDFYAGKGHLHHFLWNVLMLQAWQARYRTPSRN